MNSKKNQRFELIYIISRDLIHHSKFPLILMIMIIISSILVLKTTYLTRQFIIELEQMILDTEILENEWRNLIIEETSLNNHSRIERIATEKLHMRYVDIYTEKVIENNKINSFSIH